MNLVKNDIVLKTQPGCKVQDQIKHGQRPCDAVDSQVIYEMSAEEVGIAKKHRLYRDAWKKSNREKEKTRLTLLSSSSDDESFKSADGEFLEVTYKLKEFRKFTRTLATPEAMELRKCIKKVRKRSY